MPTYLPTYLPMMITVCTFVVDKTNIVQKTRVVTQRLHINNDRDLNGHVFFKKIIIIKITNVRSNAYRRIPNCNNMIEI